MKRTTGFRVKKSDGRIEWLRATKLARSIAKAIAASRGDEFVKVGGGLTGEDWRAVDLTTAILTGLRSRFGKDGLLRTSAIADAVQRVLLATGYPRAAEEYARVGGERSRRRSALVRYASPPVAPTSANRRVFGSRDVPIDGGRSVDGRSV